MKRFLQGALRQFARSNTGGLLLLIAMTWAVYGSVGQGFFSPFNLFTLSQVAAQYAVIGFAQLTLLALGRMNLAVGAVAVMVVMFAGWLMGPIGLDPIVSTFASLAVGILAALIMGWLELKTGLNSFIVTLAMASVYTGAVLIVTGGASISVIPASLIKFGGSSLGSPSLSLMVLPAILVTVGLWYYYTRTASGWKLLAVGANEHASRLSGLRPAHAILLGFGLSGFLSGLAGLMEMSRVAAALPSLGATWLLTSFIVPVLGGTSLKGGSVSVGGALLAAVFLASINSGLVSLNVPAYWQQLTLATVLLLAVVADELRRKARFRRESGHVADGPRIPERAEGALRA